LVCSIISTGGRGCNYIVCVFAFGSLTHEQAMRSLELFTSKVMPAFIGGDSLE
jgi:hypothetical protein